jgi:membrane-bound inhibitor of C-type lysozyme
MRLSAMGVVTLIASLALASACRSGTPGASAPAGEAVPGEHAVGTQTISASFVCAGGKQVHAVFVNGSQPSVSLSLADGRHLDLPQAMSASGARYANGDGSVVFWNKGRSAFLDENGQRTYDDCQQAH